MESNASRRTMASMNAAMFRYIKNQDFEQLALKMPIQLNRIVLPSLVRMCLCQKLNFLPNSKQLKTNLWRILSSFNEVDDLRTLIEALQSPDFNAKLDGVVRKEEKLRAKVGQINRLETCFFESEKNVLENVVESFEKDDYCRKLEIVMYELIILLNQRRMNLPVSNSELFDSFVSVDEIVDCTYFAITEFPLSFQLSEIVEAFLLCKNRLPLICQLVSNFPESLSEICLTLLHNASDKFEDENSYSLNRLLTMRSLWQLDIEETLFIRSEALELCKMPNLITQMTLDQMALLPEVDRLDLIGFLTGVLLNSNERTRNWYSSYIKQSATAKTFHGLPMPHPVFELRHQLLSIFEEILNKIELIQHLKLTNEYEKLLTDACALMRLYCAFRGIIQLKFTDEEGDVLFRVVTIRPRHSYIGVRFVSYSLCLIFSCLQLVNNDIEPKIAKWIQWLAQEESYLREDAGNKSSFGEILLLISIHFHSNQTSAISELLASVVGIKLPISASYLTRIKNIFIKELFNHQNVAMKAVEVPATKRLNSSINGTLPVHCVFHLLKNQIFAKNNVDIGKWIFQQLCCATAPVHSILPSLISMYVESIFKVGCEHPPIPQASILRLFQHKIYSIENSDDTDIEDEEMETDDLKKAASTDLAVECYLTTQLLLLYYLLLYEDANLRMTDEKSQDFYDRKLWNILPITYLCDKMKNNQNEYGVLMPKMVSLLFSNYKYLCLVKDWLPRTLNEDECVYEFTTISSTSGKTFQIKKSLPSHDELDKLTESFAGGDSIVINGCFERILKLPDELLWPLAEVFVLNLPVLIKIGAPKICFVNARAIWFRLNSIFPTKLWNMTLWAFKPKHYFSKYNENTVQLDNLIKMSFEKVTFTFVELVEIFLYIFNGCIQYFRSSYEKSVRLQSKNSPDATVAGKILNLSAQLEILSVVKMIREVLHTAFVVDGGDKLEDNWNSREVQGLLFKTLHQMFIEDANICKYLHHFGYNRELLPLMVAGIPSMHICSELIFDLVKNENEKKIFAFDLFSHLCHHYPVDRFQAIAYKLFQVIDTLFENLTEELLYDFLLPLIPSLQRMCRTFPVFAKPLVKILLRAAQEAHLNKMDDTLLKQFGEEDLLYMDWYKFEKFCTEKTDPHNRGPETLNLTIHKALGMIAEAGPLNQIYQLEFEGSKFDNLLSISGDKFSSL